MRGINAIVLVLVTCAAGASNALAAAVTFTNVADSPTDIAFGFDPSVSGSNVAFVRLKFTSAGGVYTGTVGATGEAKVVGSSDTAPGHGAFTTFGATTVSGSNLAIIGSYSGGGGIYTGTVGATGVAKVVDTTDTAPGHGAFTGFIGGPSIGGSDVAFRGDYAGGNGIYTGTVGATGAAKVVDTTDIAPGHTAFTGFSDFPSVSGSNVAFGGDYGTGNGIYTGSVGATGVAKVVDTTDTAPGHGAFTGFANAAASISGSTVAFRGTYNGGQGIYIGTVGAMGATKVVQTGDIAPGHGPFTDFGGAADPSVSGSNVAFLGDYSGGRGIFLATGGAKGSLSAVLNTGDPLFGSTVDSLFMDLHAYDNDAIAFWYRLADGRSGIGVAIVPEPTSLSLLALSGLTLLRRRPRAGAGSFGRG